MLELCCRRIANGDGWSTAVSLVQTKVDLRKVFLIFELPYFMLGAAWSFCVCALSRIILRSQDSVVRRIMASGLIVAGAAGLAGLISPRDFIFTAPWIVASGLTFWALNRIFGWSLYKGNIEVSVSPYYVRCSISSLLWTTAMVSICAAAWSIVSRGPIRNPIVLCMAFLQLFLCGAILPHVAYSLATTRKLGVVVARAITVVGAIGFLTIAKLLAPNNAGPMFFFSESDRWIFATAFTIGWLGVQAMYFKALWNSGYRLQARFATHATPVEEGSM